MWSFLAEAVVLYILMTIAKDRQETMSGRRSAVGETADSEERPTEPAEDRSSSAPKARPSREAPGERPGAADKSRQPSWTWRGRTQAEKTFRSTLFNRAPRGQAEPEKGLWDKVGRWYGKSKERVVKTGRQVRSRVNGIGVDLPSRASDPEKPEETADSKPTSPKPPPFEPPQMIRDPQCGEIVPWALAVSLKVEGQVLYFCSEDCRDSHEERLRDE